MWEEAYLNGFENFGADATFIDVDTDHLTTEISEFQSIMVQNTIKVEDEDSQESDTSSEYSEPFSPISEASQPGSPALSPSYPNYGMQRMYVTDDKEAHGIFLPSHVYEEGTSSANKRKFNVLEEEVFFMQEKRFRKNDELQCELQNQNGSQQPQQGPFECFESTYQQPKEPQREQQYPQLDHYHPQYQQGYGVQTPEPEHLLAELFSDIKTEPTELPKMGIALRTKDVVEALLGEETYQQYPQNTPHSFPSGDQLYHSNQEALNKYPVYGAPYTQHGYTELHQARNHDQMVSQFLQQYHQQQTQFYNQFNYGGQYFPAPQQQQIEPPQFSPYELPLAELQQQVPSNLPHKNGPNSAIKRERTVFKAYQTIEMERQYMAKKYLTCPERIALAQNLKLTDRTVKVWFQNRRQREKKDMLANKSLNQPFQNYKQEKKRVLADEPTTSLPVKTAPAAEFANSNQTNNCFNAYENCNTQIPLFGSNFRFPF